MPEAEALQRDLQAIAEAQKDSESRLRAVEAAVIQLTEISKQLKESAQDREARLRILEKNANLEHHDEDHEERITRLERLLEKSEGGAQPQFQTAPGWSEWVRTTITPGVLIMALIVSGLVVLFALYQSPKQVIDKIPTHATEHAK